VIRVLTGIVVFAGLSPSLAMAGSTDIDQSVHILFAALFITPVLYFMPAIIAASKDHPQPGNVFFVNLFLGWTVIGWFVSLFWAIEKGRPREKVPLLAPAPVFTPELAAKELEDLIALRNNASISEDDYLTKRQQILARWTNATSAAKTRRFRPASA
jgi:hypothetical protein